MKLSVLIIFNDQSEENINMLKDLDFGSLSREDVEFFITHNEFDDELKKKIGVLKKYNIRELLTFSETAKLYNDFVSKAAGEYCTVIHLGSVFDKEYFSQLLNELYLAPEQDIAMGKKVFDSHAEVDPRADDMFCSKFIKIRDIIDLKERFSCFPWFFEGTVIKTEFAAKNPFDPHLGLDAEKSGIIKMLLETWQFVYVSDVNYTYTQPGDNHYRFFVGVYDIDWYYRSLTDFILPLCKFCEQEYGCVPVFVQHFVLEMILCRFRANQDNRNKHLLEEPDNEAYFDLIHTVLVYLDDMVICNLYNWPVAEYGIMDRKLFLKLKYNNYDLQLGCAVSRRSLYATFEDNIMFSFKSLKVNILLMDYHNGVLEIDGTYPNVFDESLVSFYAYYEKNVYNVNYNQRYTITKYFGVSCYKRRAFHLSVPIDATKSTKIFFVLEYKGKKFNISTEYKSNTSRISTTLKNDYWKIGDNLIVCHHNGGIQIKPAGKKQRFLHQAKVFKELLKSQKKKRALVVLGARLLYFITRPFFRKKNIWVFYDKIYKGGDSSEYLYKYAVAQKKGRKQKDNISCYYLIDRHVPDAKRLKKEGYKPVYRNTLMHRLLFFNADMMIVSNSTVFAFNDMVMWRSTYFRGIVDFHVACVQHGLSVQKIAIAQNRLRDNTRLYFCASKYEIENLSKPVYDYAGYDALKLTGVPRYDGLVDRSERQIMISPTWRMQSAMLVTKNEGVARDYNPNFRDTPYFNVFNSLINDSRLLDAAKKYGYRIAYVLHPIVSPQAGDFDKNDYVDIIPATGDMSYEKLFCESSLMVTDYSGIQFDFAYMRKPLVYLHHDDIPQHYEEGTYHYDTMAFGEIVHNNDDLIDLLIEYMQNGCKMKDMYKKRADDFFEFSDHNNCKRIYDEIIAYQKKIGKISN